jgi:hypothetical protein
MAKRKITACDAKRRLIAEGIDFRQDFHQLRNDDVCKILDAAKAARYHKSKNAPGSRARMYYQYLKRKRGC